MGAVLAFVLVFGASCKSADEQPSSRPLATEDRPDVALSWQFPSVPRFGELVDVTFKVTNLSPYPILLRSLDLEGQIPRFAAWVTSSTGKMRSLKTRVAWNPRGSGETDSVLTLGLLFSGETIEWERLVRVRSTPVEAVLRYQELPMDANGILYPELEGGRLPAGDVNFVEGGIRDRDKFRRLSPGDENRVALVVEAASWPVKTRYVRLEVEWNDASHPAAILEDLGVPGAELSRWDGGDAWVIRRPEDGALEIFGVAEDSIRLPGVSFTAFDLADACARLGRDLIVRSVDGEISARDPFRILDILLEEQDAGRSARIDILDASSYRRSPCLVLH